MSQFTREVMKESALVIGGDDDHPSDNEKEKLSDDDRAHDDDDDAGAYDAAGANGRSGTGTSNSSGFFGFTQPMFFSREHQADEPGDDDDDADAHQEADRALRHDHVDDDDDAAAGGGSGFFAALRPTPTKPRKQQRPLQQTPSRSSRSSRNGGSSRLRPLDYDESDHDADDDERSYSAEKLHSHQVSLGSRSRSWQYPCSISTIESAIVGGVPTAGAGASRESTSCRASQPEHYD